MQEVNRWTVTMQNDIFLLIQHEMIFVVNLLTGYLPVNATGKWKQ